MNVPGPSAPPEVTTWSVEDILQRAREARLFVSTFQPERPSGPDDVRKLFESLYRGYPVGTLLLWETEAPGEAPTEAGPEGRQATAGRISILLDGREAITSLVSVLLAENGAEPQFRLFFNLKAQRFEHGSAGADKKRLLLPLPAVADTIQYLKWLQERAPGEKEVETANQLVRSIRDYRIPVYIITTQNEAELRGIFERTGKPHRTTDMFGSLERGRWAKDVRPVTGHRAPPGGQPAEQERAEISTVFLPKRTDTHADGLAVAGLGELLANIGGATRERVLIRDRGGFFELSVTPALSREDIDRWDGAPFYPYVKLKGDTKAPPGAIDYEGESAILADARKAKAKAKGTGGKRKKSNEIAGAEAAAYQEATSTPHPEIALLRTFNGKRSGFKGDIDTHRALRATQPREALWKRLQWLSKPSLDLPVDGPPPIALKASQWFLPLAGKGVSRVKADGAGAGQFSPSLLDWFEVWLRYIGMYQALTSHGVGDDLKLAVIAPAEMDSGLLRTLREDIRGANIFGGKIDVRAPLELARALVLHSEEYLGSEEGRSPEGGGRRRLRFASRTPRDVVRGLYVTTYKKMGSASSVMNLSFFGVPSWARLAEREDAEAFLATLDELNQYQKVLRDDISEDIETLHTMRDFLSAGTTDAALTFFARVAFDVMKRLAAKSYAVLFSTDTPRRVLMGLSTDTPIVAQIIEDEGFKRVAKAVRAATIHAQMHTDSVLQPRYGLAQAWRQKAAYKDRFVEELACFAQQFNADIVRREESDRKKGQKRERYPSLLTTEDLDSVLRLIDTPGSSSSLVANLLLAFGFAQVPRSKADTTKPGSKEKQP